ncbi:palmitoyltransferase ZDHHC12 isoform X2 [Sceloporus undulatus]|uniref:palmitoyltransferase ZDHHC12 isoform X2 n=1 Tax=Sceloporus undulatus TaxID=8520 RepID=UPI001C4CC799|nr:palmitoyltransferase ZDHHC12 isoform X2 [Sceloporus undulatus]
MRRRLGLLSRGGWVVRAAQTGLSWGVTAVLFLHPTDLRRQLVEGELLQPLVFVSLVFISVLLYYMVSLMDPGYVEHNEDEKESVSKEQKIVISQHVPAVQLRRCGYCMLKPMRAKHCRECQHCVRRYDHHCPWIENCVGERNHPLFIVYLAVQLGVLLWAMVVAWSGLHFKQFSWAWLQHTFFLLLSFLVIVVCTVIAVLLLGSHLYLISCNTTTWEFMSRHRISYLRKCEVENPFDQGLFLNLWRFFCSCHLVAWENLYPQEESSGA